MLGGASEVLPQQTLVAETVLDMLKGGKKLFGWFQHGSLPFKPF